jgi:hypothetical protein
MHAVKRNQTIRSVHRIANADMSQTDLEAYDYFNTPKKTFRRAAKSHPIFFSIYAQAAIGVLNYLAKRTEVHQQSRRRGVALAQPLRRIIMNNRPNALRIPSSCFTRSRKRELKQ